MSKIFVSYRRDDSADIAGRIYDRLTAKFGRDAVFKDVDSIPLGTNFKKHLTKIVQECVVELVIIGRQWVTIKNKRGQRRLDDPRDFVRIEIESALSREIPVVPLLVQGASMPSEEQLPTSLAELAYRHGIEVRRDPDFHRDMNRLETALEQMLSIAHQAGSLEDAIENLFGSVVQPEQKPEMGSSKQSLHRYFSGQHVHHPKYGNGIVVASKLFEDDEHVDVAFESQGLKRLSANLASLVVIPDTQASTAPPPRYRSGQRVRHNKFGEGTIIGVRNRNDDQEIDVTFLGWGIKRLSANVAKLEVISDN
jgi:hypothetical protein